MALVVVFFVLYYFSFVWFYFIEPCVKINENYHLIAAPVYSPRRCFFETGTRMLNQTTKNNRPSLVKRSGSDMAEPLYFFMKP
jgi:hypothetical protein